MLDSIIVPMKRLLDSERNRGLTCAIGGGCYHPEALYVGRMRESIDGNSQALKDVLSDDAIRKEFLGDAKKSDAAVVKAFVKSNSDNALKTRPKVSLFFPTERSDCPSHHS